MKAVFDGQVVAETGKGIEWDEYYYFPKTVCNKTFLQLSDTPVSISIAGEKTCYNIVIDGKVFKDAAFSYANPHKLIDDLQDYIAFHERYVTDVGDVDTMTYMNIEFWRITAKSVTKYDPKNRDENGHYLKDEWTCISDIGKIFDDEILTPEEYYKVEGHYALAAIKFFAYHGCKLVRVAGLHKFDWENSYPDADILLPVYNRISENDLVSTDDLSKIVKLALRGAMHVSLFCDGSEEVAVRFGYDYYMYFNTTEKVDDLYNEIEDMRLFVW